MPQAEKREMFVGFGRDVDAVRPTTGRRTARVTAR